MRIVVDVSPLSLRRTGIGNYLHQMLAGLAELTPRHEIVAFAATGIRGARRVRAALTELDVERRIVTLPLAHAWRSAWSRAAGPRVERFTGPLDVFHFSDWMYPRQRSGVRATTIHDLFPLHFPELVHPRTLRMHSAKYTHAAATCDVILANSAYTAADVETHLRVSPDRIRIAYPAVDPRFRPDGAKADLGAPYILTVSTIEPRKNLATLTAAFERLRRARPELQLAVAGAVGPGVDSPTPVPGMRMLGFVSDDRLAELYRGATAFVYPSLFEGFGMPVVEALASGAPTVASSHPSLDEAAGEAAERADPRDPEAIAEAVDRAVAAADQRREAGVTHARRFSRRACAEAVLAGYESTL